MTRATSGATRDGSGMHGVWDVWDIDGTRDTHHGTTVRPLTEAEWQVTQGRRCARHR